MGPILAFYFTLLLSPQEGPELIGPYLDFDECEAVEQFLTAHGYETEVCEPMPTGQEARRLEVVEIP